MGGQIYNLINKEYLIPSTNKTFNDEHGLYFNARYKYEV